MGWLSYHRYPGETTEQHFAAKLLGTVVASATTKTAWYAAYRPEKEPDKVVALVFLLRWSKGEYNFAYKDLDEFSGPCEAECPERVLVHLTPLPACHHEEQYCKWCGTEIVDEGGTWMSPPREGRQAEAGGPHCYTCYRMDAPMDPAVGRPRHEPGGIPPCGVCGARDWRERCHVYNQAKKAIPRLRPGLCLLADPPLEFRDRSRLTQLWVVDPKRRVFAAVEGGFGCYRVGANSLKEGFMTGRLKVAP